ncbi:MAG: acyl carrier protein [Proteobacteria bacterium]|nr:acyl carrier protein [Pseudomonadota bacterium]MBU1714993.1 acyl carrier protein [Pseudomonadota bacterium]
MTTEVVKEKIRTFIQGYIQVPELKDDEDYFASRLVNSMFAMQLVLFVEKEFAVQVESEDLEISNFNSVNSISGLVARKNGVGHS